MSRTIFFSIETVGSSKLQNKVKKLQNKRECFYVQFLYIPTEKPNVDLNNNNDNDNNILKHY